MTISLINISWFLHRYIAIKTPIRSKTIVNLTNLIIGGIWVLGLLLSSAVFSITDASHVQIGNDTVYICEQNVGVLGAKVVVGVNILVTFLLPVSILVYVYSSMALVIFRRDLPNTASLMIKRQQRKVGNNLTNLLWRLLTVPLSSPLCTPPPPSRSSRS